MPMIWKNYYNLPLIPFMVLSQKLLKNYTTMKRFLIFALFISLFSNALTAQNDNNERREEKIKAFRIAIFSEELNLTSKEAEAFWPAYNEFLANRDALNNQTKPSKQLDAMSDAEVEDQIKKHFERQTKGLDLERELYQKLRNILPNRKIAKLPMAERRFRESLVKKAKEMKDKKEQRQGGNRKGRK
jgi:hypothetical protein